MAFNLVYKKSSPALAFRRNDLHVIGSCGSDLPPERPRLDQLAPKWHNSCVLVLDYHGDPQARPIQTLSTGRSKMTVKSLGKNARSCVWVCRLFIPGFMSG